jgi:uncharacterized damage-inducible protein DinB
MHALALGDLDHELANTRRMLERVPMDRADWRPHAKSWTLQELATHIAQIPMWAASMPATTEYDFAGPQPPRAEPPATTEALLALFDDAAAKAKAAVGGMDDAAMLENWTLRSGDHVIMQAPRAAMVRSVGISHLIHHRGQLSLYLRLLDVPMPGMYGGSADEQ